MPKPAGVGNSNTWVCVILKREISPFALTTEIFLAWGFCFKLRGKSLLLCSWSCKVIMLWTCPFYLTQGGSLHIWKAGNPWDLAMTTTHFCFFPLHFPSYKMLDKDTAFPWYLFKTVGRALQWRLFTLTDNAPVLSTLSSRYAFHVYSFRYTHIHDCCAVLNWNDPIKIYSRSLVCIQVPSVQSHFISLITSFITHESIYH